MNLTIDELREMAVCRLMSLDAQLESAVESSEIDVCAVVQAIEQEETMLVLFDDLLFRKQKEKDRGERERGRGV